MMAEAGPDRGCMLLIHGDAEARRRYDEHVAAAAPRGVLLPALRRRAAGRPGRGPLLLAAGGKDELIGEKSTALLHRDYRRRQPNSVTDYQVFPGLDHTLGLGTPSVTVLFYCLDWLTAQNM
jgi:alpha-beta hydrolase superfamily lysophospholipase